MFRAERHVQAYGGPSDAGWVAGMDFGLRSPTVILLARLLSEDSQNLMNGLHVVQEYLEEGRTLDQHLDAIETRGWPRPLWVAVDPAGEGRNGQTGFSDVAVIRRRGYPVRVLRRGVRDGIDAVRRRLDHDRLWIDPGCTRLIEAMTKYHFDAEHPERDAPVKDGPDHACDALRYLVNVVDAGLSGLQTRSYLTSGRG